jgi:hypothetical protein
MGFGYNDVGIWRRNFRAFDFITAHGCDCKNSSFSSIAPIAVAVLDVDLYLPDRANLIQSVRRLRAGRGDRRRG